MSDNYLTSIPPTPEGAKLNLSQEQEQQLKVIYKRSPDGRGALFAGLWNPEEDYTDEFIIVPLRSTFEKISEEYPKGTIFANVEGSADDLPKPGNWLPLLREKLAKYDCETCCAEKDKIYKGGTDDKTDERTEEFKCTISNKLCGGHILIGKNNSATVEKGNSVSLLPICTAHNIFNYKGEAKGQGKGYYMKLSRAMKAVVLKGYLEPPQR